MSQVFSSFSDFKRGIISWPYEVITPAANLAVSLDDVKTHLKIPLALTTFDNEITAFIRAATLTAEGITRRTFINTEFRTFRDFFDNCFLLKRSKTSSISQIQRLVDGVLTVVDNTIYFFTEVTNYSEVLLNIGKDWPDDEDDIRQAIRIEFVAGYGIDDSFVPDDIKLAIKMIVANLWINRGDCGGCGVNLPPTAMILLGQYKIIEISTVQRCS